MFVCGDICADASCVNVCADAGGEACCQQCMGDACSAMIPGRDVGIAVGVLFLLGTIVAIYMLATTSSSYENPFTGVRSMVTNARFIPSVLIGGLMISVIGFFGAYVNGNQDGTCNS